MATSLSKSASWADSGWIGQQCFTHNLKIGKLICVSNRHIVSLICSIWEVRGSRLLTATFTFTSSCLSLSLSSHVRKRAPPPDTHTYLRHHGQPAGFPLASKIHPNRHMKRPATPYQPASNAFPSSSPYAALSLLPAAARKKKSKSKSPRLRVRQG